MIKADGFATWHEKFQDKMSVGDALSAIFDMRGAATLKEMAQKIARQHRPVDLLELPEFHGAESRGRGSAPGRRTRASTLPAANGHAATRRVKKAADLHIVRRQDNDPRGPLLLEQ